MNLVQNSFNDFKLSNSVKALGGMVALGAVVVLMGATNGLVIWGMSTIVIVVLAKAADLFSNKQEAIAQAEQDRFQQANVISLADYRAGEQAEVAA